MVNYKSFKVYKGLLNKLKPVDTLIFWIFTLIFLASFFLTLHSFNNLFITETTIYTGNITEGVVGVPISANPLTSQSQIERDISKLLHSSLISNDGENGFRLDLAKDWDVVENVHTFTLRDGIRFHDGEDITTEDVLKAVNLTQNLLVKNAFAREYQKVEVSVIDEKTISFTIPEENIYFPEAFTIPIPPSHIWTKIPTERLRYYNEEKAFVGSGPFKYKERELTIEGKPISISFTENKEYFLGRPFIQKFKINFYDSEKDLLEALYKGQIDSLHSVSGNEIQSIEDLKVGRDLNIYTANSTRVFGVFFNVRDGAILFDNFLRSLLSQGVNREEIIEKIFKGYAIPTEGPFPTENKINTPKLTNEETLQTLEDIGWNFDGTTGLRKKDGLPLEISILVPNVEELVQTTEVIAKNWESFGISVNIETAELEQFVTDLREGNFDAYIYGYDVPTPQRLINIWHSGLNLSIAALGDFGNTKLNELLERLAFEDKNKSVDDKLSGEVYNEITLEIIRSNPAVFLYSPKFTYLLTKTVKGVEKEADDLGTIKDPSERFLNIHKWYVKKEKVWKIISNING